MASSIINVQNYGTLGAGQDTSVFQRALDAVPSQGGMVVYPAPVYVPTGALIISKDRTQIRGAGIYATKVIPGAAFAGEVFDFTNGESVIYQCSIKGWGFEGAGTNQKIAIRATDYSELAIEDIAVHASWTGNGSIGLQSRGRDKLSLKKVHISADRPISIEDNPNSTIDLDHAHFEDLYLSPQVTTEASIHIDPNINITNFTLDGYQTYCGGKYGLYWNDTEAPGSTSLNFNFQNIRTEQMDDPDGYAIYINHYVQGLLFQNVHASADGNGFYLRNVKRPTLQSYLYYGTAEALNLDSTCNNVVLINGFEQVGSTRTMTGLTQTFNELPIEIWQPS